MRYRIYSDKLEKFLREENHQYIPRKIKSNENLKIYKRYWDAFSDTYYKIEKIYNVEDVEYYSVKYLDSMFGEISFPVDFDYTYELMVDKNNLDKIDIINNKISYSGAEIKYWFFINNIDLGSEIYNKFWPFIDPNSKSVISDDKYYFIFATLNKKGQYRDCKVSLDKYK